MQSSVFRHVLLTGGAGFIGSNLTTEILARFPAARITIIDNFCTGQRSNIESLLGNERVQLVEHDLTDLTWLQKYLEDNPYFSLILHFASPASPPGYQSMPVLTYQVNAFTTHYLAEYAAQTGARMVFASTSEVYGDPAVHPQPETYWGNVNPNGIRSCYDESKRLGETICGVQTREFDADIRIVRIFNTYGPNMDLYDGRVIPDFCLKVLQNQPVEVFGDGSQTRSFTFVDDLVRGVLSLAGEEGLKGETVNIGNTNEFTMLELLSELEKVVGHPIEVIHKPLPGDDPKRRQPNIDKAKKLLQWQPEVSLAEGLPVTFGYFQSVVEREK